MREKQGSNNYLKLLDKWQKESSSLYGEEAKEVKIFSDSGIPLKPVFGPLDIEGIPYDEIGMPGVYPFTRGIEHLWHKYEPIRAWIFFGFGLPEETRERMELFLNTPGFSEMAIAVDMPTYYGYDPDHPIARGRVGQSGTSICNTQDLEKLFHEVPFDKMRVAINAPFASSAMLALLIAYTEKRGFPPHKLKGHSSNRMFKAAWGFHPCFPAKRAVKVMVELAKYCCKHMPEWRVMTLDGYIVREQGGNAIQELAFVLATSIGVTEQVIEAGLSPDDFLSRISLKLNAANDFFEEIAKFRAFRKIWAKINKERFGCKNPKSLRLDRVVIQTGGATLTAQQPLNNIIRVTVQTLAAILGGIPLVDPAGYDEALAIPTEEAETIALRTWQILFHENNVRNVVDPMAGSYYVEYLTKKIEEEVYKMLEEIESRGGFVRCWEDGWFRTQIEKEAYKWRVMVDRKEKIVVGVNEYVTEEEVQVPVFRVDPQVEKIMLGRLKEFKNNRDNERVKSYLENLREVVINEGELMPALIEAARADATLGEMMDVLRGVYGWQVYR